MTITFPSFHGKSQITVRSAFIHSITLSAGASESAAACMAALGGPIFRVGKHWVVEGEGFRHYGKYEPERDLALEWRSALLKGQE